MSLAFFIPYPSKDLSPNSRGHWSKLARARKKAKQEAYYLALEAGVKRIEADRVNVKVTFFPPDNRRRDIDNAISSCKAILDGISLALGVDDSKFNLTFAWGGTVMQNGLVKIELDWQGERQSA